MTTAVILAAVVVGLIYNLIMELNKTKDDTFGDVAIRVLAENPALVFIAGVLYGHLFFF